MKSIRTKAFAGIVFLLFVLAVAMFLPAWTFDYWQAWVFLAVFGISVIVITVDLARRDPQLLGRRVKAGPGAVCGEFYKSRAVIIGTVTSEEVADMGDIDGWSYRLNVTRVFKGAATAKLSVFTENASARFPLLVGDTYLLFVREYRGKLMIDSCGNSVPVSEAGGKIKELEEIAKASSGTIEGRVVSYLPPPKGGWKGLEAVRVVATGKNELHSVVTDRDGWFHITVPTGTYQVRAEGPPQRFALTLAMMTQTTS